MGCGAIKEIACYCKSALQDYRCVTICYKSMELHNRTMGTNWFWRAGHSSRFVVCNKYLQKHSRTVQRGVHRRRHGSINASRKRRTCWERFHWWRLDCI